MGIYFERRRLLLPVLAILVFILVGCGEEIGRIEFDHVGDGSTEITIDAGKAAEFWTDLDLKKEEKVSLAASIMGDEEVGLSYAVVVYRGGELVQRLTCDPLDVSSFDLRSKVKFDVSVGATQSFKYNGKMKCSASVSYTGDLMVEVTLAPVDTGDGSRVEMPDSFKLSKADLVIKQE
jgi:hypothetical protein